MYTRKVEYSLGCLSALVL